MADFLSIRRIFAITVREFNEIMRDPLYLTMAILVPSFIMIIFGYGLALDVENLHLGVCDRDKSRLSREYVDSFIQSETFKLIRGYDDLHEISEDLQTSKLRAALIIPENFQHDIYHGIPVEVQMLIDGTIPLRAEITRGYAEGVHNHFLTELPKLVPQLARKLLPREGYIEIIPRVLFNSELKSVNFIAPGLIATVLMFYPALLTTLSIVREKQTQSIIALYCSPARKSELLLGKLMPYLLIALINFTNTFLLAIYLFAVPFRGSVGILLLATILYVIGTCGLGLMISVLVSTQVAAILITMVVTILPSFLYTGFFVPLSTASWSVWILGRFVSATYYLDILRGIFLKGTGWAENWPAILMLLLYAGILYGISFKVFKKRLD